eukprot:6193631-Pleurochrysis_carterae.AAC.2
MASCFWPCDDPHPNNNVRGNVYGLELTSLRIELTFLTASLSAYDACRAQCAASAACLAYEFATPLWSAASCELHTAPITHTVPKGHPTVCFLKPQSGRLSDIPAANAPLHADSNRLYSLTIDKVLRNRHDKFYALWGQQAWVKRGPNGFQPPCWGSGQKAADYLANIPTATQCHRNWYEGSVGGAGDIPVYTVLSTPILLGTDPDIFAFCSHLIGKARHFGVDTRASFQTEIGQRCIWANYNILRLSNYWNMWEAPRTSWAGGAATGNPAVESRNAQLLQPARLHRWTVRQKLCSEVSACPSVAVSYATGGAAHHSFTLPKPQRSVTTTNANLSSCRVGRSDVFFAEAFMLHYLCDNITGDKLMSTSEGESLSCKFNHGKYRELTTMMLQSLP